MKKVVIKEINNHIYTLIDEEKKEYIFNIEFIDIEEPLQPEDIIYIDESLLIKENAEYSYFYSFGNLNSKYGRKIVIADDKDLIRIEKKNQNKKYTLKRLYG